MRWFWVVFAVVAWVGVVAVFLVRDLRAEADREFLRAELARLFRDQAIRIHRQGRPSVRATPGRQPSD